MIKYDMGLFGFRLLLRLHGSALFKSTIPALASCIIYIGVKLTTDIKQWFLLDDTYPIGALIAAFSFVLAFRANFSYTRWWEAYSSVYTMHSRFLDAGSSLAAYHLQAKKYDGRKPPSFGEHPEIVFVERRRIRVNELSLEELDEQLMRFEHPSSVKHFFLRLRDRITGNNNHHNNKTAAGSSSAARLPPRHPPPPTLQSHSSYTSETTRLPKIIVPKVRKPSISTMKRVKMKSISGKPQESVILSQTNRRIWRNAQNETLFLEEAAHLLSLLGAVAFATLRNDIEGAESPLITFDPREPFPHVDPDDYKADVRKELFGYRHRSLEVVRYLLGISRKPTCRTMYNAARPFRVVGGVSDSEVAQLQAARGPLAKVSLVNMWLQEFMSREYLAGSMGDVAAPVVARLHQYISDGLEGYNHARKIAYVPFPFVQAQLTSFFILIIMGFIPIIMLEFVQNHIFGFFLNFLTVMIFTGLHEVARELENPFQNVPNDVPLNNFHSQFNHALMTMFNGFHPDAFWEVKPKIPSDDYEDENELAVNSLGRNSMSEGPHTQPQRTIIDCSFFHNPNGTSHNNVRHRSGNNHNQHQHNNHNNYPNMDRKKDHAAVHLPVLTEAHPSPTRTMTTLAADISSSTFDDPLTRDVQSSNTL